MVPFTFPFDNSSFTDAGILSVGDCALYVNFDGGETGDLLFCFSTCIVCMSGSGISWDSGKVIEILTNRNLNRIESEPGEQSKGDTNIYVSH